MIANCKLSVDEVSLVPVEKQEIFNPLVVSLLNFEAFRRIYRDKARVEMLKAVVGSLKKVLNSGGEGLCSSLKLSLSDLNSLFDWILRSSEEELNQFLARWFQFELDAYETDLRQIEQLVENLDNFRKQVMVDNSYYLNKFLLFLQGLLDTGETCSFSAPKVESEFLSEALDRLKALEEKYRIYTSSNVERYQTFKHLSQSGYDFGLQSSFTEVPFHNFLNLRFFRSLRSLPPLEVKGFLCRYFKFLTSLLHPDRFYKDWGYKNDKTSQEVISNAFDFALKKYSEICDCREDQVLSLLSELEAVEFFPLGRTMLDQIDNSRKKVRELEDFIQSATRFRKLLVAFSMILYQFRLENDSQKKIQTSGRNISQDILRGRREVQSYVDTIRSYSGLTPLTELIHQNRELLKMLTGLTYVIDAARVHGLVPEAKVLRLYFHQGGKIFFEVNPNLAPSATRSPTFHFGWLVGFCAIDVAIHVMESQEFSDGSNLIPTPDGSKRADGADLILIDVPPHLLEYVCRRIENSKRWSSKRVLDNPERWPWALIISPYFKYGFALLGLKHFGTDSPG